ncbi:MAG: hypothetical protein M0R37_11980 [Bacteroidales bacterium]|jgi:hypothetical protein|nr:hypothetical protein [Bacteroidales bacterium]
MLMTRPCTVDRTTRGDPDVAGDAPVTAVPVSALCEIQQSQSSEIRDGVAVVVSVWNLYGFVDPASGTYLDVGLAAGDVVEVDEVAYAVDGRPWVVRDPLTGSVSHVQARVRLAE